MLPRPLAGRPAGPRPHRLRRPGDSGAWSRAGACSSPAPAAPSAGRSAEQLATHGPVAARHGRHERERAVPAASAASRSTAPRCSCTPRWPTSGSWTRMQRWATRYQPGVRLPRRRPQARAAHGGRNPGRPSRTTCSAPATSPRRRDRVRRRAVRLHLDRQGGQPDQRDGRDQARWPSWSCQAAARRPPHALRQWCASATCSAPRAAWSRNSSEQIDAAVR